VFLVVHRVWGAVFSRTRCSYVFISGVFAPIKRSAGKIASKRCVKRNVELILKSACHILARLAA